MANLRSLILSTILHIICECVGANPFWQITKRKEPQPIWWELHFLEELSCSNSNYFLFGFQIFLHASSLTPHKEMGYLLWLPPPPVSFNLLFFLTHFISFSLSLYSAT